MTRECSLMAVAIASALAFCRSTRTIRVVRLCRNRLATFGAGVCPRLLRHGAIGFNRACEPRCTPAVTSLWPLKNFVVLCTTRPRRPAAADYRCGNGRRDSADIKHGQGRVHQCLEEHP